MAERYVSALTGPEMDAALLDMAQHNSEAWAVGTRNGTAVSSSDGTYQNNSKYYATEAEAAAARAEAAVPAGTEGAVLFSQAQSLTDAQKVQARSNISAGQGGTNPNLLDNPWFTVNQRGWTTGTGTAYCVDRWKVNGGGLTATVNSDGTITLTKVAGSWASFAQPLRSPLASGQTCTLSVMTSDGVVYSATREYGSGYGNITINGLAIRAYMSDTAITLYMLGAAEGSITIKAVKVEVGSVSTLANDVQPNYVEELLKCQHYYYASRIRANLSSARVMLAFGWVASADGKTVSLFVPTPVPMRNVPQDGASLANGGFSFLNPLTGAYLTYQTGSITVLGQTQAGVTIQTGANVAITTPFVVAYTGGGGGINLSADL